GALPNLIPAHRLAGPAAAPPPAAADPYAAAGGSAPPSGGAPYEPAYQGYEVERPRRKPKGMSTGAVFGLIGGIVAIILVVVVVIIIIVNVAGGSRGPQTFTLRTNEFRDIRATFEAGQQVEVTVTSTNDSDVD